MELILAVLFILFVVFRGKYAVTFVLHVIRPRGEDLTVTHQVKDIEAPDPEKAMKKGYNTLSAEQKKQVVKVYMKRDDDV